MLLERTRETRATQGSHPFEPVAPWVRTGRGWIQSVLNLAGATSSPPTAERGKVPPCVADGLRSSRPPCGYSTLILPAR